MQYLFLSPLQQWLHERDLMLCHKYTVCVVILDPVLEGQVEIATLQSDQVTG